jgi:4-hydroxybenzoyl-CoA thioesterase
MPFRARLTVRFGEVDSAGVVYYPRFLHYVHVAMEEFFAAVVGRPYPQVVGEDRFGLPAVRLETDFHRPLRYGDALEIEVRVVRLGRASVEWRYVFYKNGEPEPAAEARVVTAGVDLDTFTTRRIPDWLRERLAPLVESEPAAAR